MSNFRKLKAARYIYNLRREHLTPLEFNMAVSLQGVLAQNLSQLSIEIPEDWRTSLETEYGLTFEDVTDVWFLVDLFRNSIRGLVTYDSLTDLNKAATASAAYGYLALHKDLVERAVRLGLSVKIDASAQYKSEYDAFVQCKAYLNNDLVCHQLTSNAALRDYSIAAKAPVYADNKRDELREIYRWVKNNGAMMGWYYDEVSGVGFASEYGIMTLASDHAMNLSLYAGLENRPHKQMPLLRHERESKKTHYVAFLLSDGDNVQVHVNGYRLQNYASKRRGQIPFGWTTSPAMADLAPMINCWYYQRQTGNDDFLAAVSGCGYCNPALLPKEVLRDYAALTADYCKKCDIVNTVLLMDSPEERLIDPQEKQINNLFDITEQFAGHDQLTGGFLYYGNLYCPVKTPGAVFWNHGKPFSAIRETLWHQGDKANYVKELANRINSYPKDCTVVEGYTAINVQYWQYSYDEVADFANLLDDDVVVVTPREFIDIMTRNVQDKTTKLYLNGQGCPD